MIIAVIPARLSSTRLPRKLLLSDTGKPLILHTIDRVLESKLTSAIFVVTEDKEIYDVVGGYHKKVNPIMTGVASSGTERIAKFVGTYFVDDSHVVVNFQGDEPELSGSFIDRLADEVDSGFCDVATLATQIDHDDASDRDVVKVVLDHVGNAMWFSRYPIPSGGPWLKHIGVYAYSPKFLRRLFMMPQTTAAGEKLEQLQWLQAGHKIKVVVDHVDSIGIDSQADYTRFIQRVKRIRCQPNLAT